MQYKSIKEVAEELRSRGELDEDKYAKLQDKLSSKRIGLIALAVVLLVGFVFGMVNSSVIESIIFIILMLVVLTGLFINVRKQQIKVINLYNFGVATKGTIENVKFHNRGIGGLIYIIYYNYECNEKILSNIQKASSPNIVPEPKKGDIMTVVYDPESVSTSLLVLDKDYLIRTT